MKNLEQWFAEQEWDQDKLPQGHRSRFLDKLESACNDTTDSNPMTVVDSKRGRVVQMTAWMRYAAVAAVALLLGLAGMQTYQTSQQELGLSSVSPEMAQAQDFFTTTIDRSLEALDSEMSPETERIIADAKSGLKKLEQEYQAIVIDFKNNQDSKAVIAAMIENFQARIGLLQTAQEQIEQLKDLKEKQEDEEIL